MREHCVLVLFDVLQLHWPEVYFYVGDSGIYTLV